MTKKAIVTGEGRNVEVERASGRLKGALGMVNRALPAYEFRFIDSDDTECYLMRDKGYWLLSVATLAACGETEDALKKWKGLDFNEAIKSMEEAAHDVSTLDLRATAAVEALKKAFEMARVIYGDSGSPSKTVNWRAVDRLSGDIRAHADMAFHGSPFYREDIKPNTRQ